MGKVAHRANETPTCEGESAVSAREPWLLVVFGVFRFSNAVIGVWLLCAADSQLQNTSFKHRQISDRLHD
jgi:hypothetical protein